MMSWTIILLALISWPSVAQKNAPPVAEKKASGRVTFADGKISFIPPPGFRPLTKEEIDLKFPRGNAPRDIFANERLSVTAGLTFLPIKASPDELAKLKEALEQMLPRMAPGLQWQIRDFAQINGIRWIHFRFLSYAIDTDIVNDMYVTSFEGKVLIFGFTSVIGLYEQMKPVLEESKNSFLIKQ